MQPKHVSEVLDEVFEHLERRSNPVDKIELLQALALLGSFDVALVSLLQERGVLTPNDVVQIKKRAIGISAELLRAATTLRAPTEAQGDTHAAE